MEPEKRFSINYKKKAIEVIPKKIGRDWVYIVRFPDARPPLMVTRATKEKGGHFWTSVPEGRQEEAEIYGKLIEQYYAGQLAAS